MPGRSLKRTWRYDPSIWAPPRYKRACNYVCFVPDELATLRYSLDGDGIGLVSQAEAAIRALHDKGAISLAPLARLLLRTESIASSKVEGLEMDVRDLARAEARVESGGRASSTAREILANIDAMVLAVEEAASVARFGVAEIVAIHERLMTGAENSRLAGRIRAEQNWVGGNDHNPCGADFVPPPPEEVARLLSDLCEAIDDDRVPPLVQAALVHAQFETIHPFADGNGRTGRALIQVIFKRRGLAPSFVPPISLVLAADKARYIRGLTAFRGDDVSPWIEQFAEATARAAWLATSYLQAVGELAAKWRARLQRIGAPRADAAAWAVMDVLPAHPVITAPVAAAATGRAKAAIYQAFEQLEAAKVLIPVTESRRNRAWEAAGLLDLIAGLDAARIPDSPR